MKDSLLSRTLFVACVAAISIYALVGLPRSGKKAIANWHYNIRLGTDLRGGMQLDFQVEWREAWHDQGEPNWAFRDQVMRQTREVLTKKVNGLGLSEATVQSLGRAGAEDRLLIELPGLNDDPERVKRVLSTAAVLDWLDVRSGPLKADSICLTVSFPGSLAVCMSDAMATNISLRMRRPSRPSAAFASRTASDSRSRTPFQTVPTALSVSSMISRQAASVGSPISSMWSAREITARSSAFGKFVVPISKTFLCSRVSLSMPASAASVARCTSIGLASRLS
jgi:hypothetical protein